jgi:hypothetical protein
MFPLYNTVDLSNFISMGKLPAFAEPECSSVRCQTPVKGLRSEEVTGTLWTYFPHHMSCMGH